MPDRRPRADPRRARLAPRHARARSTASSPASTASTTCPPSRASASTTSCSTCRGSSGSGSAPRSPTPATDELPEIDSLRRRSFPTAEFQEREVYDFFGIVFRGHPDLRRILLPEDYVGWPQRRDFPVGGEPVIFTHNEHEVPRLVRSERARIGTATHGGDVIARTGAQVIGTSPLERTAAGEALEPEQELLTINMGPHHPATHGVLRLLVSLEGEVVRDLKPVVGYVHTGIEKSCEDKSLLEGDPVRRADGLPLLLLQHAGVLRRRRAAARARDPAAGQVPAGDPPGAEPAPLAPGLARDLRPRPRRDVDVLLLLPRARPDPRPVRDVDRAADAHPLLPGRRRLRGHPGRLRAQAARVLRRDAVPDRPVRGAPRTATRSSCSAPRASAIVPRSGCSTSA